MPSNISRITILIVLAVLTCASAGAGGDGALNLSEFQRVLRTGLDGELAKIADGSQSKIHQADQREDQREIHTKRRSNMRRRTTNQDNYERQDSFPSSQSSTSQSFFEEHVWDDLLQFAWKTAYAIKRDEHRLSVTSNPEEAHPCPFLVCTRGRKHPELDGDSSVQDIMALFGKPHEDSLLLSSSHNETCLILTTTAVRAHQVTGSYRGSQSLVAVPLLDITKIHAGTIDEVSSRGWSIPYTDQSDQQIPSSDTSSTKNETDAINEWERMIVVDLVPGLGGMKEEAELLEVVNNMMADIQDMGEVGWLRSMDEADAEKYVIDESLVGVPALSDMFSLTSSLRSINDNARITFWHDSFKNGIESEHACNDMFSTLFVKPRAGYYSYDLVMNPSDGPPPQDYESSASNPACVTSLIAAISTHPYVLSVKANFPIYHGWHVAQKLDSF
eukprot:CAMPEP_0201914152 /NCGR_PEP_ID=MMETSP0903-20130614/4404_1 /ASSEMBLY_ACC=CAM_ASM_000552 /TAXON_ID=420261 /ORGANISM="Thalassiosira antarctica, Strain CCMP982" /LENGTH=444 /DNA_ID=CAMNT_0048449479 /DNA_START=56 /DNA_END=1393 /DNA_ORIENTATION=-